MEAKSEIAGRVLELVASPGQRLAEDDPIVVLESMKMEIEVRAPVAARVHEVHCAPGKMVQAGQALVTLVPLDAETPRLEAVS